MPTESLEVWVDVGGTFTDCLIRRTDATGVSHRDAIKVLSSGLVSAQVISWDDHQRLATLQLPAPYAIEGFWNSANLVLDRDNHSVRITTCEKVARDQIRVALDGQTSRGWNAGEACTLDANIESPVLATRVLLQRPLNEPLPPLSVRMGTTRGTNALLTRTGAPTALLITEGFADLLAIGTQDRPDLFALDIVKPTPLATHTVEVPGRLDADGDELLPLDEDALRQRLSQLKADAGAEIVLAICLMHSYRNDVHERRVQTIAQEIGFANVLCSSDVVSLPRIVPRAETTTLDAYLQPILEAYVQRVWKQFGGAESCHLRWMTSNGNLVASLGFRGKDSVLSGPAGGVVALADVARQCNVTGAVGLDMGGTSTDVSRYEGQVGRRQESNIGGIRVLSPMMDIHTIASGGGSICEVRDGRLHVGPDSAGAFPGPACYGNGGPLTVTDINVLLGRLPVDRFPFPLDLEASRRVLSEVHSRLPSESTLTPEGLADGFLQLAVTQMAEAVRVVTTAAGSDARQMALVGFGGAAGGHLCQVADALEMTHVIDHPDAGLLSAVGMGAAKIGRIHIESIQQTIATACSTDNRTFDRLPDKAALQQLAVAASRTQQRCEDELQRDEKIPQSAKLEIRHQCEVRPVGTQSSLSIDLFPLESLPERFDQKHLQTFGYVRETMPIETVTVRCEVAVFSRDDGHSPNQPDSKSATSASLDSSSTPKTTKMWVDGVDTEVELWDRDKLQSGQTIRGPSIIAGPYSVLVVEPGWQANLSDNGILQLLKPKSATKTTDGQRSIVSQSTHWNDIVAMEIAARRVQGIAEAMGEVIRRTSVSVNVKERRDYSCAVFLGDGSLVANAPHVPVHLGAMSHTVRSLIAEYPQMSAGDSYISNDPFAGGSHLPDLTVVTPVFCTDAADRSHTSLDTHHPERPDGWPCDFFVASRCHHAEIGGIVPGSMAPAATCLAEEGVVLHNECLVRSGQPFHENMRKLLSDAAYPSRNVEENMADIAAAEAAGQSGARRIQALAEGMGKDQLLSWLQQLLHVAGEATATWIQTLGSESRTFEDSLDDGTPIRVTLTPDQSTGRLRIDFTGTGPVHPNGFNATRSIVTAAVLYVLRCVSPGELPLCDGVLQRIELIIPPGLLAPTAGSSPENSPAVVAGNVETSNRVVDVLLGCLGVAAASQGTMNNLLLGDDTFGYYETIGGGAGATSNRDGADAVHTHMTNTRITDPEILESRLPVRLWRFAIRQQSGGAGRHRGGNGIIREFEFLRPLTLSLITSRRETKPYGMDGGEPGKPGQQTLIRDNTETLLPFATTQTVSPGDCLIMETPGGGGYGTPINHSSPGSCSSSSSPNSESASSSSASASVRNE
ncbi:hydantoinase B/oxoprolinase family protein [Rhodopirellula sp. JC740]|uniref:Hydantoinase B/oxoprolinase family protein n=1 Tax=Rhodopirellula halodulae TaxID=2894198 RepID=A0ABS8NKS9_9BACT|nr:hydantoinase B/oxoprolinase family protein [Rhodopirellula sp. JC740]MCC9644159.1 hydantoinase B/oxoprolinase family protein [Rhodopirellula sp. JC740]